MKWSLTDKIQTSAGLISAGTAGSGEPLILAHGWPWSSYCWHRLIPGLSEKFKVYWYDMPGYGMSEKNLDQRTSLDVQGNVFCELIKHWGLENPSVIAHDFGGASSSGCLEETATGVIESNSAWYTFKTNASGQLGFNIGHDSLEDWDFALYLAEDCADLGDPIRCNFFDNSDENQFIGVGEDPTGATTSLQYEDWLTVTPGETYYLLINNFSSSDSGFTIQFTGDIFTTNPNDALDCSIISNLLGAPLVACENETITLDATASNGISYRWFSDTGNGFQEIIGETNSTLVVNTEASYRVEAVVSATETIISDVWVAFSQLPIAQPISDEVSCASEDVPYNLGQKDIEVLGTQDPSAFAVSYYSSLIDAQAGTNELPKLYFKAEGIETIYVRVNSLENPKTQFAAVLEGCFKLRV